MKQNFDVITRYLSFKKLSGLNDVQRMVQSDENIKSLLFYQNSQITSEAGPLAASFNSRLLLKAAPSL